MKFSDELLTPLIKELKVLRINVRKDMIKGLNCSSSHLYEKIKTPAKFQKDELGFVLQVVIENVEQAILASQKFYGVDSLPNTNTSANSAIISVSDLFRIINKATGIFKKSIIKQLDWSPHKFDRIKGGAKPYVTRIQKKTILTIYSNILHGMMHYTQTAINLHGRFINKLFCLPAAN